MRSVPSCRHLLRWPVAVALALLVCGGRPVWAQRFPPDPVEELRRALKTIPRDVADRKRELTKDVAALRTLGELRRALVLQDWRDEDPDEAIAAVDKPFRTEVARRFEEDTRRALHQGDPATQEAAADMLAELGVTAKAVGSRTGVAQAYGQDLAELVRQSPPAVRRAAAHALGQINPNPDVAVPALAGLLRSPDRADRLAAADALDNEMRIASELSSQKQPSGIELTRGEMVKIGATIVPAVGPALGDADPEVRRVGAQTLRDASAALYRQIDQRAPDEIVDPEEYRKVLDEQRNELAPLSRALRDQAPTLARALRDRDHEVILRAAQALDDLAQARALLQRREAGGPPVRPAIPPMPMSPKRSGAALPVPDGLLAAAGQQPPAPAPVPAEDYLLQVQREAFPALTALLREPDPRLRLAALDVIESLGPDAAQTAPAVTAALRDCNRFVRWAAARALNRMSPTGAAAAMPELVRLLADPDLDVDLAAAATLERYGPDARTALPALVANLRDATDAEKRIGLIRTLQGIGFDAEPAIPALVRALGDPDARVRQIAAEAIGRFGPRARGAEAALRRQLDDTNADVRRAVSDALLSVTQPVEK